ncbi:unnamed protein product [Discula destructiva]
MFGCSCVCPSLLPFAPPSHSKFDKMGGGNGAKSKQARERAAKNAPKTTRSGMPSGIMVCQGRIDKGKGPVGCVFQEMPTNVASLKNHHQSFHSTANYDTLYKLVEGKR